jgi:hypothetical protein
LGRDWGNQFSQPIHQAEINRDVERPGRPAPLQKYPSVPQPAIVETDSANGHSHGTRAGQIF